MTAPAVGIDLGTTNSVIAVSTGGRPQVLTDASGSPLIPSVVSFLEDGTRLVGRTARQRRALDPRNTVYSVKRLLGRPFKSEEVRRARSRMPFELKEGPDSAVLVATRSGDLALPELSAMVLREVRRVGEEALGDKVEKCVITVPANFNELQRSSTKVAGRVAELEVIRILNEPTAAALAYGYGRGTKEKICIFDFGGGTFDVTLLELSGNVFEVLATAGDTFLGGDDIDVAVTDSLVQNFQRATKLDPLQDRILYDVMRDAVEMAKCQLSTEEVAKVNVDFNPLTGGAPVRFHHTLSRDDLERLAAPFISRTFDVCTEALKLAGLRATDLTAVILVGGSTRIPSVRSRVASFFGRDPLTRLAPEEVVGLGASILAEALGGARRNQPTRPAANRVTASHASQPPPMNPLRGNTLAGGAAPSVPPGGVPSAGVPGVEPSNPGTARNTLTGIGDDSGLKTMPRMPSMSPGGSPLRAPTPPPIPAAAMRQTSPTIAPAMPSAPQPTPSSAGFELDDPFAEHGGAQHPRPPVGERTMAIESSDALGALDEPSFMGRIPKGAGPGGAEGPELGARTLAAPVSAFNLDDPSLMAPNPTLSQPAAHDDAWESPPAKPPLGAAPKARGPLRIGPPQRFDAPQSPPVQTPAEARQTFGMDPDVAARLPPSIAAALSPPPAASAASVFGDAPEIPKGPTETSVPSFTLDEPTQAFMHEAPKPATREVSVPSFALDEPTQAFMSAGSTETSVPSFRLDEPTQAVDTSGFNFNTGHQAKATTEVSVPAFRIDADDIFGKGAPGETTTAMAAPSSALIVPPPLAGGAPAAPSRGGSMGQGLPDALSTLKGVAPAPSRNAPAPGPLPTLPPATGNRPQPPMPQAAPVSSPPGPRSMPPGMGAPLLLDVTPFSLGVETAGGLCETVIARNATIPVEQTRNFATTHDNQTAVVIRVAQGESRLFKENQGLGELELSGLRPALRGEVVIAVTFELEADGTMRIRAREVASGLEQAVRVNLLTMPSEAAQAEMMARSRQGVAVTAG